MSKNANPENPPTEDDAQNMDQHQSASEKADVGVRETKLHEEAKKRKMMAGVVGVVALVVVYYIFSDSIDDGSLSKNEKIERVEKLAEDAKPLLIDDRPKTILPPQQLKLPELEAPAELPPPPPPPPPPSLPSLPEVNFAPPPLPNVASAAPPIVDAIPVSSPIPNIAAVSEEPVLAPPSSDEDEINFSAMGIIGGGGFGGGVGGGRGGPQHPRGPGGGGGPIPDGITGTVDQISDRLHAKEVIDEAQPLQRTSAAQVRATYTGDLRRMIRQGKVIHVTLETAINTELEGTLRAIVNTDVYAEAGRDILLPKGSRVMGKYQIAQSLQSARITIIWDRVMRPDGVEAILDSPGIDQLGRTGVEGELDNRFMEAVTSAFLTSVIPLAGNIVANNIFDKGGASSTVTTSPDGTITRNEDTFKTGIREGINQVSEKLQDVVSQYSQGIQPVIKVDQGTKIKVFVNKDIIF